MRGILKLFLLWVGLILLFLAFYKVFSARPDSAERLDLTQPVLIGLVVFVIILFVVILRAVKGAKTNNEALGFLAQGRYQQALERFEAARPRMNGGNHSLIQYNIGYARLCLWQLNEAEVALLKARKKVMGTDLTQLAVPQLALTCALLGKVDAASRALDEAEKMKLGAHATALVARGVLAVRRRDWASALESLRRQEVKQLGGAVRALADGLVAWALFESTGEQRHVDRVTLFNETGPERLRAHFPELVGFLERAPQS